MGVLSSSSPPSQQPYESPACSAALPPNDDSDPTVENHSPSPRPLINRKKKKTIDKDARSSSSRSASCSSSIQRGTSLPFKRRVSRVRFGPVRRSKVGDVESIALPLGMSFAAVVAQVLERKDVTMERLSPDYLSVICTSAVRESLANVFGDKFDCFVRNFEKSFGSTLRTLRLINESSKHKEKNLLNSNNVESSTSDETSSGSGCYISSFDIKDSNSEVDLPCIATQNRWNFHEEVQENIQTDSLNQELAIPGQVNQLACVTPSSVLNHSVLGTIEKSVIEQVRSNDLKTLELGLTMEKLKLKERQLALNMDSNHLERSKLAMGISKASFKAEKFKNQLEDTRHTELLKKCIDCLVAGLFIMTFFLIYGAYIYSYKKITDATSSCNPSLEESKSWWIPKPMASFNSGLHTLKCQVQVMSQMMFAFLIILAVAYLIVQRSAISKQTMPVTFIMLLLGIACGLAGKFCVDMLGGNGYFWLVYWEILCLLHFLSNVFTSVLFIILHGPVNVSQAVRERPLLPYWIRRSLFYSIILLILPLLCGLMPFASLSEWKDHFMVLVLDADGGS